MDDDVVDGDVRLIASARMRPPMLPGPSQRHFCGAIGAGPSAADGAEAANIAPEICGAGANSTLRAAALARRRSTCAFARAYASRGMRPRPSRSFIN